MAPRTTEIAACRTSEEPAQEAGYWALKKLPSGTRTSIGRKFPWFTGSPGSRNALRTMKAPVAATAAPLFIDAESWDEDPEKSTIMLSPWTIILTRARIGSPPGVKGSR